MALKTPLPYGRQMIGDEDVEAVVRVLRSDWLTTGPEVEAFEAAFAETVGAPFALACSSGTAALHISALAADLGPGDLAVVPSMTFVATANAVRLTGAEVLFADVDPETGLMGPEQLEEALARVDQRPSAVFPVHLNGQCAQLEGLFDIATRADLRVVEDGCHALGTIYNDSEGTGHLVGAARHADLVTFSFHPVKVLATGEGGMVTTREPAFAERLRRLRSHGIVRTPEDFVDQENAHGTDGALNPWYYEMLELGLNYRASDIACALGRSQLTKLDVFAARRRALAAAYDRALASLAPLVRPVARSNSCEPAWHLYAVLIDFDAVGRDRAAVMRALTERGVGSQVHYIPVHRQPYYRNRYGTPPLPGADIYYGKCLSLPLFPSLADDDVDRVVDALKEALNV